MANNDQDSKNNQYFIYYSSLTNQQNMLLDHSRTNSYFNAINCIKSQISNQNCMDVGAGSGILSYFVALNKPLSVFSIEASSSMCANIDIIKQNNQDLKCIKVINKMVEHLSNEIDVKVKVIVSEPIGVMIFHERMVESFLLARDLYLEEEGTLIPNKTTLYIEPINDNIQYMDLMNKTSFWTNQKYYGIDVSCLYPKAREEAFSMPIVGYFDPNIIINKQVAEGCEFDFYTIKIEELYNIEINREYTMDQTTVVHGFGSWFDINLVDNMKISTSPYDQPTHWQQIKLMMEYPLGVNRGDILRLQLKMKTNNSRSYDLDADIFLVSNNVVVQQRYCKWKLHDQSYSYNQPTINN